MTPTDLAHLRRLEQLGIGSWIEQLWLDWLLNRRDQEQPLDGMNELGVWKVLMKYGPQLGI